MKNNTKFLILIFFIFFNFFSVLSDEIQFDNIKFEASKIEYLNEKNLIIASGNVKVLLDNNTEITAEKSKYDRAKHLLIVENKVELKDFLRNQVFYYNLLKEDCKVINIPYKRL